LGFQVAGLGSRKRNNWIEQLVNVMTEKSGGMEIFFLNLDFQEDIFIPLDFSVFAIIYCFVQKTLPDYQHISIFVHWIFSK